MTELATLLKAIQSKLNSVSAYPTQEAERLMIAVTGYSRAFLYAHGEQDIDDIQVGTLNHWVIQRLSGIPLAYVLGFEDFWKMRLKVTKDTLIPRPATECLIEAVLQQSRENNNYRVHDLGTGSGAIAIALASERPHWKISASDVSLPALQVAKANANSNGCHHITWYHSDWFKDLPAFKADLLIANPPYIANDCPHLSASVSDFEPALALFGGDDGLSAIHKIVSKGKKFLNPCGLLAIEHGFEQQPAVIALFKQQGYVNIQAGNDLAGHPRFVLARLGD